MAKEMTKKSEVPVAARRDEQDPLREMISFRDTINGMFEDFFSGRPLLASASLPTIEERGWIPPVDIRETNDELIVYAGLLGIKKEDCRIEVRDNTLILSGERKEQEGAEDWLRRELPYGAFYRAFTLPSAVKAEQVKASYREGLLEIHLPKSESAKARTVAIE